MLILLIICIICGVLIASQNETKSPFWESMKIFFGTIGCIGFIFIAIICLIILMFI